MAGVVIRICHARCAQVKIESDIGDEHNAAREAFDAFSNPQARPIFAHDLGDSRCAVLFRAVTERRVLAGAIMIVVDTRGIQQDDMGLSRLMTPRMQQVLSEFTAMRTDKLAQAAITAMVQMARVLGMHTVTKHTATAADHEWLTALGVDFVQSNALSPAFSIDSLSIPPTPKT